MKNIVYRKDTHYPPLEPLKRQKILITGADGWIGGNLSPYLADKHDLRLMVIDASTEKAQGLKDFGEVVECRLEDLETLKSISKGIDTVIHLAAGVNYNLPWKTLLDANIIGHYNAIVAALAANCRRFIFTSSVHAVSAYPPNIPIETNEPVNPGNVYGVTKVFGEALCRYTAVREGLSSIVIRIAGYGRKEHAVNNTNSTMMGFTFIIEDLHQMLDLCIEDTDLQFALVNGVSDNRYKRLALDHTIEALGYDSEFDSYAMSEHWDGTPPADSHEFTFPIDPEHSGFREDL
jgi:nucleoside-diphosphate-sugar epimerase